MKITKAHLDYWRLRKCPTPGWFKESSLRYLGNEPLGLIDNLINLQSGVTKVCELHNTNLLLSLTRKRNPILEKLAEWADPTRTTNPTKRNTYCRRLLRRHARAAVGRQEWRKRQSIEKTQRISEEAVRRQTEALNLLGSSLYR